MGKSTILLQNGLNFFDIMITSILTVGCRKLFIFHDGVENIIYESQYARLGIVID